MAVGTGEAPYLTRESFQGLIGVNRADIYESQHAISKLYMRGNNGNLRLRRSSTILVEFERAVRGLGVWKSKPGTPDAFQHSRYGLQAATTAFKAVIDSIPADHVAALRMPGMPTGNEVDQNLITRLAREEATAWVQKLNRKGVEQHLRDFEWLCCQMLSSDSFTWNISGVDLAVSTGIDAAGIMPGGTSWADSSADIPGDLGVMRNDHRMKAGRPADIIIFNGNMTEYFSANEAIREWNIRRGEIGNIAALPVGILPPDMRSAEIIEVYDQYEDVATGGLLDFWPDNIIAFVSLGNDPQSVLDTITAPTNADDFMGGLWGNVVEDPYTKRVDVVVGFNGSPLNLDTSRISLWDVTSVEE